MNAKLMRGALLFAMSIASSSACRHGDPQGPLAPPVPIGPDAPPDAPRTEASMTSEREARPVVREAAFSLREDGAGRERRGAHGSND